jgi:hypothetical protein
MIKSYKLYTYVHNSQHLTKICPMTTFQINSFNLVSSSSSFFIDSISWIAFSTVGIKHLPLVATPDEDTANAAPRSPFSSGAKITPLFYWYYLQMYYVLFVDYSSSRLCKHYRPDCTCTVQAVPARIVNTTISQ